MISEEGISSIEKRHNLLEERKVDFASIEPRKIYALLFPPNDFKDQSGLLAVAKEYDRLHPKKPLDFRPPFRWLPGDEVIDFRDSEARYEPKSDYSSDKYNFKERIF